MSLREVLPDGKAAASEVTPASGAVAPAKVHSNLWIALCFGLPIAILAGAFAWLAFDHGRVRLWNVIVHESGRYTLGQTVFYFPHFLREIPTVVAMALFVVVVYSGVRRTQSQETTRASLNGLAVGGLLSAAALISITVILSIREIGVERSLHDLMQLYTRDDIAAYGSHWRFHWLSTAWFGAAAVIVAWLAWRFLGSPRPGSSSRWTAIAWGWFILLTVIFGLGLAPFIDARYIGHQAREILTHATVTLPLGFGLIALQRTNATAKDSEPVRAPGAGWVMAALAIPVYLAIAVFTTNAMDAGQTEYGLAAMVGAHYFEHTLDYVLFALLVVGFGSLTRVAGPSRPNAHPS